VSWDQACVLHPFPSLEINSFHKTPFSFLKIGPQWTLFRYWICRLNWCLACL
jgi:hypothetical protein